MTILVPPDIVEFPPDYEITESVVDSGYGLLYRARRRSDGAPVFLKTPVASQPRHEASARLRYEYEMTRRAAGDGVIAVYGLEQVSDRPVLVLEDFGAEPLDRVTAGGALDLDTVLEIGIQLADGLAGIHARNIVHKNINPSNVAYNRESGIAKLIDFGMASYLRHERQVYVSPWALVGSLPYISPEQTGRMNRAVDYRTDFYSLGAVLYEMLTGRRLFEAVEPIDWLNCHIAEQPLPPANINRHVPRPVSDIVMKLLAKAPEQRYRSGHGISADLSRCLVALRTAGVVEPFNLGASDVADRFTLSQTLIGREQDVARLLACFERVATGSTEIVLVSGRSGIGKTSLVREIYRPITERRGYFAAGKFDRLHRDKPYAAFAAALRELICQLLREPEDLLAGWKHRIQQVLGSNGHLLTRLIPELELIIGPQPAPPALPPQEARQLFERVFERFIQVFAAAEHPLVMFLDDLQWADAGSLRLLDLLTHSGRIKHLLLIGAYRNDELRQDHPLLRTLDDIRAQGKRPEIIEFAPLNRHHVVELLAESLNADPHDAAALAEIVEQKTGGNPFFAAELLKLLDRQGLNALDATAERWRWDIDRIRAEPLPDSAIALITTRLQRLSTSTQRLMTVAACIGHRFRFSILAHATGQDAATVAAHLHEALAEEMVIPLDSGYQLLSHYTTPQDSTFDPEFTFCHDHIRHAAYALLDEDAQRSLHLTVGRLLLERVSRGEQEALFDAVSHLSRSASLITAANERLAVCRFGLAAGVCAKQVSAYEPALTYLRAALELLPASAWADEYELTLTLHVEAAEAAYLSGNEATATALISAALCNARTLLDEVRAYDVQVSALMAKGAWKEAIDLAVPILNRLGHRYAANPSRLRRIASRAMLRWKLGRISVDALRARPAMTDPHALAAQRLADRIAAAAQGARPGLLLDILRFALSNTTAGGHSEVSANMYNRLAIIACAELGDIDAGQRLGRLAVELSAGLSDDLMRARNLYMYAGFVQHWKEPLRSTLEPLRTAHDRCIGCGDFEYGSEALTLHAMHAFESGMNLELVAQEATDSEAVVQQLHQHPMAVYLRALHQLTSKLLGRSDDPTLAAGAGDDTASPLAEQRDADRLGLAVHLCRMRLGYWFGDLDRAMAHSDAGRRCLGGNVGLFSTVAFHHTDSLIRLALCRTVGPVKRRRLLRQVHRNQVKMKAWACHNPANCMSKYCLVEAERLHVLGREFAAYAMYDRAVALAREHDLVQDEALANERAGLFHAAGSRGALADIYLRRAHEAYVRWGARAKADDLERRHPELRQAALPTRLDTTADCRAPGDVASLREVLKAIADEQVHSRMLDKVIGIALELSHAQRGVLILRNRRGEFCIEAEATVDQPAPRILQSTPITDGRNLCLAAVNHANRTRQAVVVDDAQQPSAVVPGLHLDQYVRAKRVRSLLCLPIISACSGRNELIGLLHLENCRESNIAGDARLATLDIICMAIANRLELSRQAAVDGLTQLYNHDYFQNVLREDVAAAARCGRALSLILCDIDHFKRVNHTWGHHTGDFVLREVARLVKQSCRDGDLVARYGGEEFAVALRQTAPGVATQVAHRIREQVDASHLRHNGKSLRVTVSIGVAHLDDATADAGLLIRKADAALSRSKLAGRNRVTVA